MRRLRNKINWVLLPYFVFILILIFLQNVCKIKFPDILYNETFSIIIATSWIFSVFLLFLLNVIIPVGQYLYKRTPFGKKPIEAILNMDKGKKKIINITCWILMAMDVVILVSFRIITKGEYEKLPPDLELLHGFFGIFWLYQFGFNFACPLFRGDFNKYLY